MTHSRKLSVASLARVEGEGGLEVTVRNGRVVGVRLDIYEPPRFFEAMLRGRHFTEPPDITSRICGICPIAYQMSSCQAIEAALGVDVGPQVRALRRLIYCGEWIESHALHVFMLHAPDFLGYDSAIAMAADHPGRVSAGLQVKKAGNLLMEVIGGRAVHPVNVRVGGFHRSPTPAELRPVAEELRRARDVALETVAWVSTLPFPDFRGDYEFVALVHPELYPITEGRIGSSRGLDIAVGDYEQHFEENQVPHSTALHSRIKGGRPYLVGAMARYALNSERLSPLAKTAARDAGLGPVVTNPFQSIVVRAVEILYACDEALRLIDEYEPPDPPAVAVEPRAGSGCGCTEAPRGILWQRYQVGADGLILDCRIVPPTSQNQATIEQDLGLVVERNLDLALDALTMRAEQVVRNHDPCISCATHFLRLTVDRA